MKIDSIFIIGTGRSGTHFLCRTLKDFDNIDDFRNGKENADVLYETTNLALKHKKLTEKIINYYTQEINKAKKQNKIFLDQNHPNLFHVEQLINCFPNALFLATDRPSEQIVSSMLRHKGVRYWAENVKSDYVYPNQFLGIKNIQELQEQSSVLCYKRVNAHNLFRDKLIKKYPDIVKRINYVELVNNQHRHLKNVIPANIFKLFGKYTQLEKPNKTSLEKYKADIAIHKDIT